MSPEEIISDNDGVLAKYVLENTERSSDGRLIMPLMWNENVSHLLSKNYNLSHTEKSE